MKSKQMEGHKTGNKITLLLQLQNKTKNANILKPLFGLWLSTVFNFILKDQQSNMIFFLKILSNASFMKALYYNAFIPPTGKEFTVGHIAGKHKN